MKKKGRNTSIPMVNPISLEVMDTPLIIIGKPYSAGKGLFLKPGMTILCNQTICEMVGLLVFRDELPKDRSYITQITKDLYLNSSFSCAQNKCLGSRANTATGMWCPVLKRRLTSRDNNCNVTVSRRTNKVHVYAMKQIGPSDQYIELLRPYGKEFIMVGK
jgi:hypothetical protein